MVYYSQDRITSFSVFFCTLAFTVLLIVSTYLNHKELKSSDCKILDIVNLTNKERTVSDIVFYVDREGKRDFAYGTDFYYLNSTYPCYSIAGVIILDNGKNLIESIKVLFIITSVVSTGVFMLTLYWFIYVCRITKEYLYLR